MFLLNKILAFNFHSQAKGSCFTLASSVLALSWEWFLSSRWSLFLSLCREAMQNWHICQTLFYSGPYFSNIFIEFSAPSISYFLHTKVQCPFSYVLCNICSILHANFPTYPFFAHNFSQSNATLFPVTYTFLVLEKCIAIFRKSITIKVLWLMLWF